MWLAGWLATLYEAWLVTKQEARIWELSLSLYVSWGYARDLADAALGWLGMHEVDWCQFNLQIYNYYYKQRDSSLTAGRRTRCFRVSASSYYGLRLTTFAWLGYSIG